LELVEDLDPADTRHPARPGKIAGLLTQQQLRCNTAGRPGKVEVKVPSSDRSGAPAISQRLGDL